MICAIHNQDNDDTLQILRFRESVVVMGACLRYFVVEIIYCRHADNRGYPPYDAGI